jgi:bisphosphoglycerate-dependent phosphoglycerate mutase
MKKIDVTGVNSVNSAIGKITFSESHDIVSFKIDEDNYDFLNEVQKITQKSIKENEQKTLEAKKEYVEKVLPFIKEEIIKGAKNGKFEIIVHSLAIHSLVKIKNLTVDQLKDFLIEHLKGFKIEIAVNVDYDILINWK